MLIVSSNMHEYFHEALEAALRKSSTQVSEELKAYVLYLLADFSHSDNLYAGLEPGEQPALALLLTRALEAPPNEANKIFRHIGDNTLYSLGFFEKQSCAAGVSSSYYLSMGEDAYFKLANNTQQRIYAELAERFESLVFLIKQISSENKPLESEELISLVSEYQHSKNPELKALLAQNGVYLDDSKPHLLV